MTPQELNDHITAIKMLSQEGCARLYRFAHIGHIYFTDKTLFKEFKNHFQSLGGMTPEISKKIGWENY
jgi:hypothetical protein